jgi:hypothetical protein
VAVHLAERVGDELDASAVGVGEVHRHVAVDDVLHPGFVEPRDDLTPPFRLHRDGEVVEPAKDLGVRSDVQPGEVEERQQVLVADVEEEV